MSGIITVLKGENLTLTTGTLSIAAFRTAAAAAAAARVSIKRLEISQSGTTTLAMIRGEMATRDTAGTLTMTSLAPTTVRPVGGQASGLAGNTAPAGGDGRSGINASTDSGGAFTQLYPFAFPNTAGYLWKPDPDEEILIPASTVFVFRFLAAPATLTGWTFSLILNEE
jgi:hypothetical protein